MTIRRKIIVRFVLFSATVAISITGIKLASETEQASISGVPKELSVPVANVVDKQSVITALTENLQIVGLEGEVTKEYEFSDSEWYGNRSYKMTLHGRFKMGFDIADIRTEDIVITEDNDIIITTPEAVLISLELPYDRVEIIKKVDLLRKDFSDADRQFLYAKASEAVRGEILADEEVRRESLVASQQALRQILSLVPSVESVYFRYK